MDMHARPSFITLAHFPEIQSKPLFLSASFYDLCSKTFFGLIKVVEASAEVD